MHPKSSPETAGRAPHEQRFQDLIDTLPEAVFETDTTNRLVYANRRAFEMFGFTSDDLAAGLDILATLVPEDRARARDRVGRRLRGEDLGAHEYVGLRKDGSTFPILLHATPILSQGAFSGFRGLIVDITDRKRVEEALARSQAHLQAIVESEPECVKLIDRQGCVLEMNPAGLAMIEVDSIEQLRGRSLYPILATTQDRAGFEDMVAAVFRGENRELVFDIVGAKGTARTLESYAVPIWNETHDAVASLLGVARDTTGRRRAELDLQRANRSLRMLGECNQAIVRATGEEQLLRDVCGLIVGFGGFRMAWVGLARDDEARSVTPAAWAGADDGYLESEAFSWAGDERGRGPTGTAIRERRPVMARYIRTETAFAPWREAALRRGYESSIALPLLLNGHACFGALSLYSAEPDAFDEVDVKLLAELASDVAFGVRALRDRAARDDAEGRLLASAQRLSLALQAANQGIYDLNVRTGEAEVSAEYATMLGYDPSSFRETNAAWVERMHLEDREPVAATYRDYIAGARPDYRVEFRQRTRTGDWKWILSLGKIVERDDEGRPVRMLGTHTDITDRKQAEAEKEKLQAQLMQAQKMESVGRLAGGVAHDFNNMLQAILGYADLALEDAPANSALKDNLLEIQVCGRRSAELTRQLLAFARKQTIAPRVLDLNDTIEGLLNMLRRLLGENVELIWQPAADPWPVELDPSQVDQILANLCVNARDAIADIGRITLSTANAEWEAAACDGRPGFRPGAFVKVAVQDDGCGMDAETMSHLFEPFFTTKAQGKGTGLGLATVYGAVTQNGGFIDVASAPGQGTTFAIYLPRYVGKPKEAAACTEGRPAVGGHETVLLVEDEPAILHLTTRIIGRLGYTVLAAGTPGEAIRLAREHRGDIHLLLTDVVMPEMNGRELAKNLLSLYPGLECLFMSGYTAEVIAYHGVLDAGVQFIQKPFSQDDLSAKLREVLSG